MQSNMHLESKHEKIARKWGLSIYSFLRFRFAALLALDCAEFARSDAVLDSCTVLAPVHGEGSIFRSPVRKSVAPELQNQDKQFSIYVAQCLGANIPEESLLVPVIPH